MRHLALVSILLSSTESRAQETETFRFDEWEAWNSFAVGSWVEFATVSDTSVTRSTWTIRSKSEDSIWVVESWVENGKKRTLDRTIERVRDGSREHALCGKPEKDHRPMEFKATGKKTVKIGKQEYECFLGEETYYDCDGKVSSVYERTYHKSVPGWRVTTRLKRKDWPFSTGCLRFEAKQP